MQITTAAIQQFFQLVDFSFRDAMLQTPSFWRLIGKKVPSRTEKNVYPWLAQLPGLREWLGERILNNLVTRSYSLTNKKYEGGAALDRDKLADDTYGFFTDVVGSLGMRVAEFPDQKLAETVEAGNTTLCWDGQNFFDTAHPVNPDDSSLGTYRNNYVGTVSGQNYDLSADPRGVFRAVRSKMMQFTRDDGKPLGVVGNLLMVPASWEGPAKDAVEATFITQPVTQGGSNVAAAAPSNVFQGAATVYVNPWLTKQDAAYLICTTKGIMPFLYQDRDGPNFIPRVDPASDNVFKLNRYEWGCDLRAAFGYTFPFLVIRFAAT